MAYTPTLRIQKGSELTWQELDDNFTRLNSEFGALRTADTAIKNRLTSLELMVGANPGGLATTNLTDVSTFPPIQGQILTWHDATSEWVPNFPSALANINIGDLLDVNTTATVTGNVLQFDGTSWVSANADLSTVVQVAGDTMTGALVLYGDPTANLEATTKQYVDNQILTLAYSTTDFQVDLAVSSIGDVGDVSNTTPSNGQVLAWNGSEWGPANTQTLVDTYLTGISFDTTTDVLTASMSDGNNFITTIPLSLITDRYLASLSFDTTTSTLSANMVDGTILQANIPDVSLSALSFDSTSSLLTATMNDGTQRVTTIPIVADTYLVGVAYDSNTWVFSATLNDGTIFNTSIPDTDTKLVSLNYDKASSVLSGTMSDGSSVNTSIVMTSTDLPLDDMGSVSGNATLDVSNGNRSFVVQMSGSVNIVIGTTGTTGVDCVVNLKVVGNGSTLNWDSNISVPTTTPFEPALGQTALYRLSSTDGGLTWFVSLQGIY